MSDTVEMIHEDALPGHESALEPKPEWEPRYPGSGRLNGKVAVITGAASGIGEACARLLDAGGARLVIADIDAPRARAVAEQHAPRLGQLVAGDRAERRALPRARRADEREQLARAQIE